MLKEIDVDKLTLKKFDGWNFLKPAYDEPER